MRLSSARGLLMILGLCSAVWAETRVVPDQAATIQAAIDAGSNGDVVLVRPGTYAGPIDFKGKAVTVTSQDPNDPNTTLATLLDGRGAAVVVRFETGEAGRSVLAGLTIHGAQTGIRCSGTSPVIRGCQIVENAGPGIELLAGAKPVIDHCLIAANGGLGIKMPLASGRGGIGAAPWVANCTIAQNAAGGIYGGVPVVRNSILSDNGTPSSGPQIVPQGSQVTYSCVRGGFTGEGNIGTDPLFTSLARQAGPNDVSYVTGAWLRGDYHLQSQAGRWDPDTATWVKDTQTSRCIDAGNLADPFEAEPLPNGGRINMGAYGDTAQASKTWTYSSFGELRVDYSSYIGGSAGEDGATLVLDSNDRAYVSCNTQSTDWPTTPGAFSRTLAGGSGSPYYGGDTAALRLNAAGDGIDWGTYIGGSQDEYHSYFSAVDSAGNLYLTGVTTSANFPATTVLGTRGGDDVFVVKLNSSGQRVWATVVAGTGTEVINGVAVDKDGFVYITGRTNSANFPTTPYGYDPTVSGSGRWDLFVVIISPEGRFLHQSTFFGPGDTSGIGSGAITLDADGNVYVASYCSRGSFTTTAGAYKTTFQGGTKDVYVSKLDPLLHGLIWATYLGGSQDEQAEGIKVAADGGVVVTGTTASPDFPTTPGAYDRTHHGGNDLFVTRLSSTGTSIEFSTLLGTSQNDSGGLAGWLNGNLVVLVNAGARELPATQQLVGHVGKMFLAILDPGARDLLFGAYIGGTDCFGLAQRLDSKGRIWVCGPSMGRDLPTTEDALMRTYQGGYRDGFVMRLSFQPKDTPVFRVNRLSKHVLLLTERSPMENILIAIEGRKALDLGDITLDMVFFGRARSGQDEQSITDVSGTRTGQVKSATSLPPWTSKAS